MSDVVVTVPKGLWQDWIDEGGLPGEGGLASGQHGPFFGFTIGRRVPSIAPGERVYIVAHGKLRGYAPLYHVAGGERFGGAPGSYALVRRGGAVAVTIPEEITGFQGFRYRWWDRNAEVPFEDWRTP